MRKLGITTIASFAVNVILSLWLVNQYYYDAYFHSYVDATLGPVYPFIVLTAGLGGGSSLGYLLLKRRHTGDGTGKLDKAKLFKSSGPVQSPGSLSSSSQGKIMPTGPPPGQVSRHTAYAVPPLPKSSTPSSGGARGTGPSSLSVTSKTLTPSPSTSQRLEQLTQPSTSILNSTLRDQFRPEQASRPSPPLPPSPMLGRGDNTQSINRIPPEPSRMSIPSQWKPEPGQSGQRGPDSTVFPRPGQIDVKQAPESPGFGGPVGQVPKPPQASQTPFPVSKWVSPEQRAGGQWTDPVPKPGLATPQKWGPPPGQGVGPRPPQGVPPRPGPGQVPGPAGQRPPFPPAQGGPRPLGYPNPGRPGQPGPVGVSPPFRPDQTRPIGPPPPGRPVQSPGGPFSQPWSPPKAAEKGESGGASQGKDVTTSPPLRPSQFGASESSRPTDEKTVEPSSPGGEMDWDTALDTILKTLKKDRGVGERT
ncbi:hypothetical protein E6H31_08220 [Candidatus Bathyarchaeota archaeon]|nr:MAG: hypothetical protein E6H31_08220 [Candidatus Bathyarchaeota archaeon]